MVLLIKILIISIPTYAMAVLTRQMVFVVLTLVISGLIANSLPSSHKSNIDESDDSEGGDLEDAGGSEVEE